MWQIWDLKKEAEFTYTNSKLTCETEYVSYEIRIYYMIIFKPNITTLAREVMIRLLLRIRTFISTF